MRKSILVLMVCLVSAFALACSPANTPADAGKDKPAADKGDGKKDGAAAADAFALYKKEGRTWMHKMDVGGNISYTKYEIVKVASDHAMMKMTMLDKDKKENEHMKPTETKIEFKTPDVKDGTAKCAAPKIEKKSIKVEAGEFEVQSADGKNWASVKYPGLLVKSDMMELVEFKE